MNTEGSAANAICPQESWGPMQLSAEQQAAIQSWLPKFNAYLDTPDGKEFFAERLKRCREYQEALASSKVQTLSEAELSRLIGGLWASEMWTDKDQPLKHILESTNLPDVKAALRELLWGAAPLRNRYDAFKGSVKGAGPATITELLTLVHPKKYAIWNKRAREALSTLKLDSTVPVKRYQVTGDEYERIVSELESVRAVAESAGGGANIGDLLSLDYFLWFVGENLPPAPLGPSAPMTSSAVPADADYDFDHDEVRDALEALGEILGFDADTEVEVGRGAIVDAVWTASVGNIGRAKFVFEVHRHGSIDSLILNLQRSRANPAVRATVAVSNPKGLAQIRIEVERLPEDFRRSLSYLEANEVLTALDYGRRLKAFLKPLELNL